MIQYTSFERVEDLRKWWKENGARIATGVALSLIAIFGWQYWGSYYNTQAEKASQETLALPVFPELKREQIEYVVEQITAFYKN